MSAAQFAATSARMWTRAGALRGDRDCAESSLLKQMDCFSRAGSQPDCEDPLMAFQAAGRAVVALVILLLHLDDHVGAKQVVDKAVQ